MKSPVAPMVKLSVLAGLGLFSGGCFLLPSTVLEQTLSQADKARSVEAMTYIGSMIRAQKATLIENDAFGQTIESLQLGIPTETPNYTFAITADADKTVITATPKEAELPSYVGALYITNAETQETADILCESEGPAEAAPAVPVLTGTTLVCAVGSQEAGL